MPPRSDYHSTLRMTANLIPIPSQCNAGPVLGDADDDDDDDVVVADNELSDPTFSVQPASAS